MPFNKLIANNSDKWLIFMKMDKNNAANVIDLLYITVSIKFFQESVVVISVIG